MTINQVGMGFNAFIDDDTLATASATNVASGESIKAYVDAASGHQVDSVVGTANEIDVDATDPVNPVLSLSATTNMPGTFTIQSSTAISGIINDDTFATALATNIPTALSVKNYADGLDAGSVKSVTGTSSEIDVDNTDAQNPILSLSSTILFPGTGAFSDGNGILDENGNEQLLFNTTASAVNYIDITNAATGDGPLLQAAGSDANIDLRIQAKGTGNILFDGSDVIFGDPGTEESGINVGGVTYNSNAKSSEIGATNLAQYIMHRHSTTASPILLAARSNSDTSAHGVVTNGMNLFSNYSSGWTGTSYSLFGGAFFDADSTGTISTTSAPGRWRVQVTPDGSLVPANALTITNDKTATFAGDIDAGMSDGELFIGSTGNPLAKSTLTPGTGISIANTAGAITISASGAGFGVATIAGTSQAAAVNTMYIALNAGQTTLTLPATFSVGDRIMLVGGAANTGGWVVTCAAADTAIYLGSATSGGGSLTSDAAAGNTIELVADVADTSWVVLNTVNTTLTTS